MKPPRNNRFVKSQGGSIFILVVWSIFMLSIFAISLGRGAYQNISLAAYFQNNVRLRYIAEAAIKAASEIVKADMTDYDALNEYWSTGRTTDDMESAFQEVVVGDGSYRYTLPVIEVKKKEAGFFHIEDEEEEVIENPRFGLVDEERKININKAPERTLVDLFRKVVDLDSDTANTIANSIIDWRDADSTPRVGGAEDLYYQLQRNPYDCKDADFQVLEELLLVRGVTPEIWEKVKNFVTLYGEGAININTADSLVLVCLNMDQTLVDKIIRFREGADRNSGTEDDNVFEKKADIVRVLKEYTALSVEEVKTLEALVENNSVTVASDYYSATIDAQLGKRMAKVYGVIHKGSGLAYWREL